MKKVKLTKNKYALVDDEDYDKVIGYNWQFTHGYARSYKAGYMHRFIMQSPTDRVTDHINMNGLDNRKSNLRLCTRAQNQSNRPKPSNNTSGHKGVAWHRGAQKWTVEVRANGKRHYLGLFSDIEEAAKAYQQGAEKYFGEFAHGKVR